MKKKQAYRYGFAHGYNSALGAVDACVMGDIKCTKKAVENEAYRREEAYRHYEHGVHYIDTACAESKSTQKCDQLWQQFHEGVYRGIKKAMAENRKKIRRRRR